MYAKGCCFTVFFIIIHCVSILVYSYSGNCIRVVKFIFSLFYGHTYFYCEKSLRPCYPVFTKWTSEGDIGASPFPEPRGRPSGKISCGSFLMHKIRT